MAPTFRTLSIVGACIIAAAMIYAAFAASGEFRPQSANAASTEEALKALATRDTDSDGLPDWEESIYGTNPNNPHSVSATLTDAEAVNKGTLAPKLGATSSPPLDIDSIQGILPASGTLTDELAQALFIDYLKNPRSTESTPDEIAAYVEQKVAAFVAQHATKDTYLATDLTVSGIGATALKAYAGRVDTIIAREAVETDRSEMDYYFDAITKNDVAALNKVREIGKAYLAQSAALAKTPVPVDAADAHLKLTNASARMGAVIGNLGMLDTDPLRALLGLGEYQDAAVGFATAFADSYEVLVKAGVTFSEGESGSSLYEIGRSVAETLAETKK